VILYLDTSALVKLYVNEPGSEQVVAAAAQADTLASSILAYPEVLATFARAEREKRLTTEEYERIKAAFEEDWQGYTRLDVNGDVATLAGYLAARYPLKGADAVHLASAYLLNELYGEVHFLAFDKQLNAAAGKLLPSV
jgi:uncharacterized protein